MPNELEERARRSDALAQALCLLDTFAGEGLMHTYGNGQTIDAADSCNELAAAFGIECEPGWYRKLATAFTQEAGWMPIEQAPRDGSWILVYEPDEYEPCVHVVRWGVPQYGGQPGDETWVTMAIGPNPDTHDAELATHFRPLPAPPEIDRSGLAQEGE